MKIESEQNTVSTAAPSLSDISSAMKGVNTDRWLFKVRWVDLVAQKGATGNQVA